MLAELNYRNLDDEPGLAGLNTTTEVLARWLPTGSPTGSTTGALGPDAHRITSILVTLHESHVAWASYERTL